MKNKKKIIKRTAIVILSVASGLFILNWYLANHLQDYLRKEMGRRISEATNGFYDFSFSKLSIGLFNGELYIEDIVLQPDSATFHSRAASDNLPEQYYDIKINSIRFKGINLVWKISYKELHFDLFEIKRPIITITDSQSPHRKEEAENTPNQNLYDLISPYIDVLSVRQMNLESASVSYITDRENIVPSVYSLDDVSFHAYGFLLNDESFKSGKLLYCDNFDFTTNKKQNILTNTQFTLNVDKIKLGTQDSIVRFDNIHILPQSKLWQDKNFQPDNYLDAQIDTVKINGLYFIRNNFKNYLNARSFKIEASSIQYFDLSPDTTQTAVSVKQDSLKKIGNIDFSKTLYSIISPVLNEVSVENIDIQGSKFRYSTTANDSTDVYTLEKLNVNAEHFLVDSLADVQQRFLYSQTFSVRAQNINGRISSKNHLFRVDLMNLNTVSGNFLVRNIQLDPISIVSRSDFMSAKIDSIYADGLKYEKGLEVNSLNIERPTIEYVKVPGKRIVQKSKEPGADPDTIIADFLRDPGNILPIFDHLHIKDIRLNKGNITFNDKSKKRHIVYRLPYLDFNATDFLVNPETLLNADFYFTCNDFNFKFKDFNNLLPGGDYRLIVDRGEVIGKNGYLHLTGIKLIPQETSWDNPPDLYLSLMTPSLEMNGFDYTSAVKNKEINVQSFKLVSPDIKITDAGKPKEKKGKKNGPADFGKIFLGILNITNARVEYVDKNKDTRLKSNIDLLDIENLIADNQYNISVNKVVLKRPAFSLTEPETAAGQSPKIEEKQTFTFNNKIKIGELDITDLSANIKRSDLDLNSSVTSFILKGLDRKSSSFSLDDITIVKPFLHLTQYAISQPDSASGSSEEKGIYDKIKDLAEIVHIKNFNITEADLDYKNMLNGQLKHNRQINSTDLSFTDLYVNAKEHTFSLGDIDFRSKNLDFPVDNGFYTLKIGDINLSKSNRSLEINSVKLESAYPKEEFAYLHPTHKDWFDVSVGNIHADGLDIPGYFKNKILNITGLYINDVTLLNLKNRKIEVEHKVMPLVYEPLHKMPVKLNISDFDVKNFNVIYEELAPKGTVPGKISITDLNGRFSGFTNIVSTPNQFIRLDADGNLMGTGHFTAVWEIPVDSLNDQFLLSAHVTGFDLKDMNQIITPLAPARVESGTLKDMIFGTIATSKGADVSMTFLYNDLKIDVLKNKDGEQVTNGFFSKLVNWVIRDDNPKDGKNNKVRESHISIERDPEHSTFNYFWQILRPPLVESIGVSQGKQKLISNISGFISKVKGIFSSKKKDNEADKFPEIIDSRK